ncbi:hypothetical protein Tsubulata_033224 [Turnera subulata]|uniref:Thionin-like protein 2 n=1 Tax=Turnera subulata TaxID=218843 RepID=A0A9Q0J552_9ROSI|nr:hypothetical protein Tsubulata_033224 [Turnera subulata]
MEGRRGMIKSLLVVLVVVGLLAAEPTAASFKECYVGCFVLCVITPGNNPVKCGAKCLKDCILPHSSSLDGYSTEEKRLHFCELGCATTSCVNISTKDNPREEEVSRCVDSCANTCRKN